MTVQFPVPDGWFVFGTFVDQPDLETVASKELDETGLPLWERPKEWECSNCGHPVRRGEKGVDWPWIHTEGWYMCRNVSVDVRFGGMKATPGKEIKH